MKHLLKFLFTIVSFQLFSSDLDTLLPKFEQYAIQSQADWKTPGMAIAIVKDDKIVYAKAFGVKEMGKSDKVDEHTIFQIGSISKSFTAALVAMSVEDKKIKWEDPVLDYYPEFMLHEPWVTANFHIEDTLAQRSGLPEHSLDFLSALGVSREDIIHALRYVNPETSFRSAFAYQNSFFLVAAEILQKAAGKPFEQLLKERLFEPLGMNETSADMESFMKSTNAAWFHDRNNGKIRTLKKPFKHMDWVYVYAPAGGINSNIIDMSKWTIFQMNQGQYQGLRLISKENMERMHRPYIFVNVKDDLTSYYCLAWVSTMYSPHPIIWHSGGTAGFNSIQAFIPEEKIGIVVLTNQADTSLCPALAFQFFDMYYGKPDQDWNKKLLSEKVEAEKKIEELSHKKIPNPTPSLPLELYAGKYTNPIFGIAEIAVEKDHLVMTLGKNQTQFILKHFDRDIFSLYWDNVDEEGLTKVAFGLGSDGIPAVMSADILTKDGNGTFTRVKG